MVQAYIWRHREYVAIFILLVALWFSFKWGNSQRTQKEANANGRDAALLLVEGERANVQYYKNELGHSVTVIQKQELDKVNLLKMAKLEKFNLEKSFNVKLKKIQSITIVTTKSKVDSVMRDTVYLTDTKYANLRLFKYKDKHNDLLFFVSDSSKFAQTDSIKGIDVRSRPDKWFWKLLTFRKWKEESTYQLTHENQLVDINSVMKMEVARKR